MDDDDVDVIKGEQIIYEKVLNGVLAITGKVPSPGPMPTADFATFLTQDLSPSAEELTVTVDVIEAARVDLEAVFALTANQLSYLSGDTLARIKAAIEAIGRVKGELKMELKRRTAKASKPHQLFLGTDLTCRGGVEVQFVKRFEKEAKTVLSSLPAFFSLWYGQDALNLFTPDARVQAATTTWLVNGTPISPEEQALEAAIEVKWDHLDGLDEDVDSDALTPQAGGSMASFDTDLTRPNFYPEDGNRQRAGALEQQMDTLRCLLAGKEKMLSDNTTDPTVAANLAAEVEHIKNSMRSLEAQQQDDVSELSAGTVKTSESRVQLKRMEMESKIKDVQLRKQVNAVAQKMGVSLNVQDEDVDPIHLLQQLLQQASTGDTLRGERNSSPNNTSGGFPTPSVHEDDPGGESSQGQQKKGR